MKWSSIELTVRNAISDWRKELRRKGVITRKAIKRLLIVGESRCEEKHVLWAKS